MDSGLQVQHQPLIQCDHRLNILLVNLLIGCMRVLLGGADKTPVKRIGSPLQLSSVAGTHSLHLQLITDLVFFSNSNDGVDNLFSGNVPITEGNDHSLSVLNAVADPGDIRDQCLPYAPFFVNVAGEVGDRPASVFFPTAENNNTVFQCFSHFQRIINPEPVIQVG